MCSRVWHWSDISEDEVQVAVQNMFLKLVALVPPVTTATVEGTFSDMEMVKTRLRSRSGEDTGLCIVNIYTAGRVLNA